MSATDGHLVHLFMQQDDEGQEVEPLKDGSRSPQPGPAGLRQSGATHSNPEEETEDHQHVAEGTHLVEVPHGGQIDSRLQALLQIAQVPVVVVEVLHAICLQPGAGLTTAATPKYSVRRPAILASLIATTT